MFPQWSNIKTIQKFHRFTARWVPSWPSRSLRSDGAPCEGQVIKREKMWIRCGWNDDDFLGLSDCLTVILYVKTKNMRWWSVSKIRDLHHFLAISLDHSVLFPSICDAAQDTGSSLPQLSWNCQGGPRRIDHVALVLVVDPCHVSRKHDLHVWDVYDVYAVWNTMTIVEFHYILEREVTWPIWPIWFRGLRVTRGVKFVIVSQRSIPWACPWDIFQFTPIK